jgi:uncharacterized protein (DUF4415 family)
MSVKASRKRSKTDWHRIETMKDQGIDVSDNPELDEQFFREAIWWPGPKQQITLRLDPDVLAFFRKRGRGYQTTINAVLRKYVEARKARARQSR